MADSRAFFASVQEYFLERTGRGLTLSSRDIELVIAWRREGATVADVCRAIDEAVQRLQKGPRDLYALRRFVDARLKEEMGHAPVFEESAFEESAHPNAARRVAERTVWEDALDQLQQAHNAATRAEVAHCLEAARARITAAQSDDLEPWGALAEVDDFVIRDLFARLTEDERRLIDLEVEAQHGAMLSMLDPHTYDATMLEGRRRALHDRWVLPKFL